MPSVPVEVAAMGWVDVAQGAYVRWWLNAPRPSGLSPDLQVAECRVEGTVVLIASAWRPLPPAAQDRALRVLRAHFGPDAQISLVEAFDTGWSRQSAATPPRSDADRLRFALAVAVIHASWGWDESEVIRVEDPAGVLVARARHDGGGWRAERVLG